MEDESIFTKSQCKEISEGLQSFIDSMVEEIVLEGKPFDSQKKYLKKFSENEGLDYEKLEADIVTFIEILDSFKTAFSNLQLKLAREKGDDCHISEGMVEKLINHSSVQNVPGKEQPIKEKGMNTLFSIDNLTFGITVPFLVFFFSFLISRVSMVPPADLNLGVAFVTIPALSFICIAIAGWALKKNVLLILWSGAALWMILLFLWYAFLDYSEYDIIPYTYNTLELQVTLLAAVAFIAIFIIMIFANKQKQSRMSFPLLISTISAALFVISHYVIFPQALWYGLFVVAIIVVGILYWKQKKEIAAMHVISSIIVGSLLAELCQGFYNYYYGEYFYLYSFDQLVENGIITVLCVTIIIYALVKSGLSIKAKALCFYLVLLLAIVDLSFSFNWYFYALMEVGIDEDFIWYLGCIYPAAYAFLCIQIACYSMCLLRPNNNLSEEAD